MSATPPIDALEQPPSLVSAIILGLVRHGLTALGGMAVTSGLLMPAQENAILADLIGIAAILISVAWSAFQKNASTKTVAAAVTAVSKMAAVNDAQATVIRRMGS